MNTGVLSAADYDVLLAEAIYAGSVLEFGPGESTRAFIEAGCKRIATCEYQDVWADRARQWTREFPQVELHAYANTPTISIPSLDAEQFDLAFVDSPLGTSDRQKLKGQEECSRLNTTLYALTHAKIVLLHDARRPGEQNTLNRIRKMCFTVEMIDTERGIAKIQ